MFIFLWIWEIKIMFLQERFLIVFKLIKKSVSNNYASEI